jgi:two-component system response regulator YesN
MHKVLLVDDEEFVVKSLKASVDWQACGFEIVGEAYNGDDAVRAVQQLKPDLVFTDIRMPGMNGLEFIKKAKAVDASTLFIIVSGYAEFAFAQKALNVGAIGYCLKPFDDLEISGFLHKAAAMLDQTRPIDEGEILDLLEDATNQGEDKLRSRLEQAGIRIGQQERYRVAVSVGQERLALNPGTLGELILRIGYRKYAYCIADHPPGRADEWYTHAQMSGSAVGDGGVIGDVARLKGAIERAELDAYHYFTVGNYAERLESENTEAPDKALTRLVGAIANQDVPAIFAALNGIERHFSQGLLNIRHALTVYNDTIVFLNRIGESEESLLLSYDKLTVLFSDAGHMVRQLKQALSESLNRSKLSLKPEDIKNRTFTSILHFVNENFCQDLSIQSLSRSFNINANYISQMFKRETGRTFTEHLTQLRMEYACQLLRTADTSIQEVAEKAGYHDYFYFSRQFKRFTGTPPSTYRAEHQ